MEVRDNAKRITHHPNAVKRRYKNKRVTIMQKEEAFIIELLNYDPIHIDESSCRHFTIRDKVRVTQMYVTKETLKAIACNALELLKNTGGLSD
jgi:hypothetical protein